METTRLWAAAVPSHEGSTVMSKKRILFAALLVLGLAQFSQADDRLQTLPAPNQLPTPVMDNSSSTSGLVQQPQIPGVSPSASSCASCPASGGCASGNCAGKSERSCFSALCSFFTYRRLPYTDINTYCCGCSGPARPPLYVYMLHPCADQAPPRTLPDLSKCKGEGCGLCGKCGRQLDHGCSACSVCGK